MSTPIGIPAIGTTLEYGDGNSPETYALISNNSTLTGLGMSVNIVDVTSHSSGTPWRQKIPTLLDPGAVSFDLYFVPDDPGHKAILALFTNRGAQGIAGNPIPFRQKFPNIPHTAWYFSGFISKLNFSAPVDGVLKASVEITATGSPTFPA